MSDLARQIRVAVRSLARTPVVSAAAITSLALGLGATTAVFSAVSAALVDGMPFAEPDRLVSVFRTTPHSGACEKTRGPVSSFRPTIHSKGRNYGTSERR